MASTKPRAVSPAIEPMGLEAIEARLTLFRRMGVTRAAFYGPHLTEVELAPFVPDAETGDLSDEPEHQDAAWRLANRGANRKTGES